MNIWKYLKWYLLYRFLFGSDNNNRNDGCGGSSRNDYSGNTGYGIGCGDDWTSLGGHNNGCNGYGNYGGYGNNGYGGFGGYGNNGYDNFGNCGGGFDYGDWRSYGGFHRNHDDFDIFNNKF